MRGFLPNQTRVSRVHLRTARLEPAVAFYSGILGLHTHRRPEAPTVFSAATDSAPLLALSEEPAAVPRPRRSVGLYHVALRYPTRQDLARAYLRILRAHYPITGASDHGVSEAIYLSDPEGNGIELYADRPSREWRRENGQIAMVTAPLDLEELLDTISGETATNQPPQPELGHIHLHVGDLAAAEQFYSEYLGFAVTQRSYPGALFFAAGGYHHHIGVNVWAGKAVPPANSVGLLSYRIEVPMSEILYCLGHRAPLLGYGTNTARQEDGILEVRDPNGTWLEVEASRPVGMPQARRSFMPPHPGNAELQPDPLTR